MSLVDRFDGPRFAVFCGLLSGLVYGIYWLPLRALDRTGFPDMWAVLVFNAVSFVLVIPWIIYNIRQLLPGRLLLHRNSIIAGFALMLYSAAFLYTEVLRVLALFYLLPVWGFLFARLFTGAAITPVRWVSMALGLGGLIVICGGEQGIPLPRNPGDWMALSAGIIWAGASLAIFKDRPDPVNYTILFLFWGSVFSGLIALIATHQGLLPAPDWNALAPAMLWLLPLALLLIIPSAYATLYAPSQLNPGLVGLLFMTEISIGAGTAALFANEPFGAKEIIGIVLITIAAVAEPIRMFRNQRTDAR